MASASKDLTFFCLTLSNIQCVYSVTHFKGHGGGFIKCCYCQLFLCDKPHGSPYSTFWWGFLWFQLLTTSQMCKPLSYEATKLPILYICTLFLTIPHSDQHTSPCCGGSSLSRGVQTSFSLAYSFSLSEWTHRCSLQCVLLSLLPVGHPQKI